VKSGIGQSVASTGETDALEALVYGGRENDPYTELRAAWERVGEGGTLTVRYGDRGAGGPPLRGAEVAALLRLAGFEPGAARRTVAGYEMNARRRSRAAQPYSCSVIVPCRNEVDNVETLVRRMPRMGVQPGAGYPEIIFVDGASTDGTPERVEALIGECPDHDIKLLRQVAPTSERQGVAVRGKAAAVYQGFDAATGDILMILDADMTVAPEDLPRFYLALAEGVAEFANGTRFVYPMEAEAMPDANRVGNRVFAAVVSWLVETRVGDTLCGTKALFKRDWPGISGARRLFGGHDPWGDFDLLLGAAYVGLRLVDVPIRYGARTAGESKMRPLQHGVALGRTCLAGARWLKV